MTVTGQNHFEELPEDVMIRLNLACDRFEQRWQAGEQPVVEAMLDDVDSAHRDAFVRELLPLEIEYRRRAGLDVPIQQYQDRFPSVDQTWLAALLHDAPEDTAWGDEGVPGVARDGPRQPLEPKGLTSAERHSKTPSDTDPRHTRLVPGTRLTDRYRIVALLGRGGMGEVYQAYDLQLNQTVALKCLPERFASDSLARDRLIREIRTARQVTHANVCRIHDLGEADGQLFLTMEYIDGEDLSQVIKRLGRPSKEKAVEIACQIGLGLAAAHEAGVIHRDLKPANIMIDGRGRVRVLDFGLAEFQEEPVGQSSFCGTPAYMAPELTTGGEPSVRSDIYALGLILYEIFTGRPAFDATQLSVLQEHHQSSAPELPSHQVAGMDAAAERVIMRCLEKNPQARPESVRAALAAFSGGASPPSAGVVEGGRRRTRRDERKLVTVMVGEFTTDAETMDPEAEWDAMDGFFQELVPIVEKYEGTIEKSLGDEIVVFFGVPVTHEDDAERALHAALEMMAALARFDADSGNNLGLRLGVNTGPVITGGRTVRGRWKTAVTGDAVKLAARLKEASRSGEILIGTDTQRLVASRFEFEAVAPIRVRGKQKPAAVYRLLAARTGPRNVPGGGGLSSSLVGRQMECRELRRAVERLQTGEGGIVTLVGEAGLGKSRLVAELREPTLAKMPSRTQDHSPAPAGSEPQWVEGRCLSFGDCVAYHLWVDAVRGLLGVQAEDPPLAVRDVLSEQLGALCPDCFDDVFPHLARLVSLPLAGPLEAALRGLGGQGLKSGAFRAVETLIESVARRRGPLVVVCEDLHWADPTSLELLRQLLALTDRAPVLLICLFRPDPEHGCWRIKETAARQYRHRHTDLWLEPLSAAESEKLVDRLLRVEKFPRGLGDRILEHAEGNPFYVEEITRSLIASGAIVWDDTAGCWQAARAVGELAIPDTLSGVLMARIDRLDEETRRVLQLAAVIGRTFYYRVLKVIARKGKELDRDLLTLQRQEMIRERARFPELEYIFKHQLTQAAAYESLLRKERRVFHRQVGEALERLFSTRLEEHLELLAHHWQRAEETERAIDYLVRAGQKAADGYANAEALAHFQQALVLAEGKDVYDGILTRRAKVRLQMFLGREAAKDYEQLLNRARQVGDREGELESLLGLAAASYAIALAQPAFALESRKQYEQAFTLASELDHKTGMVRSLVATSWFTDFWPQYWDQAVANVDKAWGISQQTGDKELASDCMIARANRNLVSIQEMEQLVSQLDARHDLPRVKEASFPLTWKHLLAGNFARCIERCETSIALATKLGMPPVMYPTFKALALLELGRYDAAWQSLQTEIADEDHPLGKAFKEFGEGMRFLGLMAYGKASTVFESVIEQATALGRAWLRLWAEAELARSLLRYGQPDQMNLDWTNQDLTHTVTALPATAPQLLGEIALQQKKLDEALRQAKKSGSEAETQGWKPCYVVALELQLRVLLQQDRPADVISLADKGLRMAEAMEYRPLLWRIRLAKARALAMLGSTEAAAEDYNASAAIVRQLAATIGDTQLEREFMSDSSVAMALEHG